MKALAAVFGAGVASGVISTDYNFYIDTKGGYCHPKCVLAVDQHYGFDLDSARKFIDACRESMGNGKGDCEVVTEGGLSVENCKNEVDLVFVTQWPFTHATLRSIAGISGCKADANGMIDVEFLAAADSCKRIGEPIASGQVKYANHRVTLPGPDDSLWNVTKNAQGLRIKCANAGEVRGIMQFYGSERIGREETNTYVFDRTEGFCHSECKSAGVMNAEQWEDFLATCHGLHPEDEGTCKIHARMGAAVPVCAAGGGPLAFAVPVPAEAEVEVYFADLKKVGVNCAAGNHEADFFKSDGGCDTMKDVVKGAVYIEDDTLSTQKLESLTEQNVRASGVRVPGCAVEKEGDVEVNLQIRRVVGSGMLERDVKAHLSCNGFACPTACEVGTIHGLEESGEKVEKCRQVYRDQHQPTPIEVSVKLEENVPRCKNRAMVGVGKEAWMVVPAATLELEYVDFGEDITKCQVSPADNKVEVAFSNGRQHCDDLVTDKIVIADAEVINGTILRFVEPRIGYLTVELPNCSVATRSARVVYNFKEFMINI